MGQTGIWAQISLKIYQYKEKPSSSAEQEGKPYLFSFFLIIKIGSSIYFGQQGQTKNRNDAPLLKHRLAEKQGK